MKASTEVWGMARTVEIVARGLFSLVTCTCVNDHAVATSSRGRVGAVGASCVAEDVDCAAECGAAVAGADEDDACSWRQH